ncbi:MAG: S4 domain-containing protein [Bacteroidales bacterium]
MKTETEVRIDKYLWSIRIFKTRSDAQEACDKGRVLVNKLKAKSSKNIKTEDRIDVRKGSIIYSYQVIVPISKRQGAKLVSNYAKNITAPEELEKLNSPLETIYLQRDKGMGRPTKKDRRDLEKLKNY